MSALKNINFLIVFHFDGEGSQLVRATAANDVQAEEMAKAYAHSTIDVEDDMPELYIDAVIEESLVVNVNS